ncbi:MAG: TRAP transporter permease [Candidatus Nezhaarchaeales archaeon]
MSSEFSFRRLKGYEAVIVSCIAVAMSLFHLYTAAFGVLTATLQRSLHLTFVLILCFLLYPVSRKAAKDRIAKVDVILAAIAASTTLYTFVFYGELVFRVGAPSSMDVIFGILCVIFTLEAARRTIGLALPLIALAFILYAYIGPYMPGILAHRGYPLWRIIDQLYMTNEGIYGLPVGVSSTFVFLFILFGAFLEKSGAGRWFIDLACAFVGRSKGGPAKIAVVSSGLFGTISGSSVANVFGTGTFTIPLMKRLGYKPYFAGAVEAAASTGGQIMPPVMGAAAFIMAEVLGIPYIEVAKAAVIPAILYFFSVGMGVHVEALRINLKGLPREEIPSKLKVLKNSYLLVPLVVIVYLLINGYTPLTSAFWGTISVILVSLLRKETRMNLRRLKEALEVGAQNSLSVATACACAGIVVGIITLTGLGLTFSILVTAAAGGNLTVALVLTMIASLILGMGLPTTAKYVVLATIAAPALIELGAHPVAAHLFILYFGVVADITPPVALAAYAGAGIAGAPPMKTGFKAVSLALAGFIVPYVFVLSPSLILVSVTSIPELIVHLASAILGVGVLACGSIGYMFNPTNYLERVLLIVSAILLVYPDPKSTVLGLALVIIAALSNRYLRRAT